MIARAIKFTREVLPIIYAEYPAVNGLWDDSMLFTDGEEYYFVHDSAIQQKNRVLNRSHFEDVYEISGNEIGCTFKRLH